MNQFQSYRFFYGMRIQHLSLLIKCATEKTYQPGEIVFKEGDPVKNFFLIKTGALALHRETVAETRVVKTVQSGDVLGWSCLVPQATWHLSGQALGPTTVTILDRERLLAAAEENPEFGCELLERAAQMEVERLENEGGLIKIAIEPLPAAAFQSDGETITGNSPFFRTTPWTFLLPARNNYPSTTANGCNSPTNTAAPSFPCGSSPTRIKANSCGRTLSPARPRKA